MKYLIMAGLMAGLFSGCASGGSQFDSTLRYADSAATQIMNTAVPMLNEVCGELVRQCVAEQDAECPPYHKCAAFRQKVSETLGYIKMAILDAESARAIGDSKSEEEAIFRAISLIKEVREQLKSVGAL